MIAFLIKRPIAVTMSVIAVVVLGLVAMGMLPVSLMPDVDVPVVTVQVSSAGMSAREISESVISPLQRELQQVTHLKDIRSESRDGAGTIHMQFDYEADIDYVFIEVNEKIDRRMGSLPEGMERPRVMKASATDLPAFFITMQLKSDSAFSAVDPLFPVSQRFMELSEFSEQVIAKRLEQLPQVAMVDVGGRVFPELLIIPDKAKLEAMGISLQELDRAIQGDVIGQGSLKIRDGEYQYSIRFSSTLSNKHDIEEVYIKIKERLFQIRDLAEVVEHPQEQEGIVRADGKHAVILAVIKQANARMDDLKMEMDKLSQAFAKDYPEIEFTLTRDQTRLLEYSIDNLGSNLLTGGVLAILVIFLFMGDFRSPSLIILTIPLSLIISLLVFFIIGLSINIISLAGLMLGLGMMVDNTIIIIDNVTQKWEKKQDLFSSVTEGTSEVFVPMLSSTLTSCAVFLPLIFLSGIAGALFYDQAMALIIGQFSSLLVAFTAIPVYYFTLYKKQTNRTLHPWLKSTQRFRYDHLYEKGVKWVFRNPLPVLVLFGAMSVGIIGLYQILDKEKLPPLTRDDMMVYIEWNQRISPRENDRRTELLCQTLRAIPVVQRTSLCGTQEFLLSHTRECGPSEALIYIKTEKPEQLAAVETQIDAFLRASYPDALYSIEESDNIFDLIFGNKEPDLVARIRSVDGKAPQPDQLTELLTEIRTDIPNLSIEPVAWQEHILYVTRPERMALYNVSYSALSSRISSALKQNRMFTLVDGRYSVPVVMGDSESSLEDLLQRVTVSSADGTEVPASLLLLETRDKDLKTFVSGAEGDYYPLAFHLPSREVKPVMNKIKQTVRENPNFEVSFSGAFFSNRIMIRELAVTLAIALFLLFFILAAQFESLIQPLIILSEVVVDIFGAFLFLWLSGASINLMSMIGIVVMCGIIINDSILKVDTINRLRSEGRGLLRAILQGGGMRIKPIIMTALTTILAILPFLWGKGMGAELQFPLSVALIGGMIVGTVVSLYVIPLFYYYIYRNRK